MNKVERVEEVKTWLEELVNGALAVAAESFEAPKSENEFYQSLEEAPAEVGVAWVLCWLRDNYNLPEEVFNEVQRQGY